MRLHLNFYSQPGSAGNIQTRWLDEAEPMTIALPAADNTLPKVADLFVISSAFREQTKRKMVGAVGFEPTTSTV